MSEQSRKKAVERAANVLSLRPYSRVGLYRRLIEKGVEADDAAYAVDRLTEVRLLDDLQYAQDVCRSCRSKGWGAVRVRQELRRRGVDEECIEQALDGFEPDGDKLRRFICARLGDQMPDRAALRRVSDGLYRRGFSWDEINEAINACLEEMGEQ